MTLLSILLVLVLEQLPAQSPQRLVRRAVLALTGWLEDRFNDGGRGHGILAWCIGILIPGIVVFALHRVLLAQQAVVAFLLGVSVLVLTVGFRHFSHLFTGIQTALQADDLPGARQLLASWRGKPGERLTRGEVARMAIEQALVSSHRHVFAPLFWFVILGPAGALCYRLALALDENWGRRSEAEFGRFGQFARQAFAWIDWLPVRLTAAAFAVVGDFEGAVHCWRTQASHWPESDAGILLASGAGALGVRLGMPVHELAGMSSPVGDRPELGIGEEASADAMQSTIGLVWRCLILCLALLTLVTVSGWVGA